MPDLLVTAVLSLLAAWIAAAMLGFACRGESGLAAIRRGFGSVRGALAFPLVFASAVFVSTITLHHSIGLVSESDRVVGDSDGCVHWGDHVTDTTIGIAATALIAATGWAALAPVVQSFLWGRVRRAIVRGIDRGETRRLRSLAGHTPNRLRAYATRGGPPLGPFATSMRGRNVIFVPDVDRYSPEELRAVLFHEREHVERGHLERRFGHERILAFLLPKFLAERALEAARAEEEWEADEGAAQGVGSRHVVARALIRALEGIPSLRETGAGGAVRFGGPAGLYARMVRLLSGAAPPPARFVRAAGLSALIGLMVFAILHAFPEWSIWAFCGTERVLGVSCAT